MKLHLLKIKKLKPELQNCILADGEFTPLISKEKMLFILMDADNSFRFKDFEHNMSKLELNNLIVNCYKDILNEMPDRLTTNQFKIVDLTAKKCVFEKLKK